VRRRLAATSHTSPLAMAENRGGFCGKPFITAGANLVIVYRPISTLEWSDPCFAIGNAQTYGGAGAATEANGGISRD
jgi:hypothetical protein